MNYKLMIFLMFLFIFLLIALFFGYIEKKYLHQLNNIEKDNPNSEQKVRILKSKTTNFGKYEKLMILLSLLIIFAILIIVLLLNPNNSEKFLLAPVVLLFIYFAFIMVLRKKNSRNTQKYILNDLKRKYGNVIELPIESKKIVVGKKNEENNIRNVYLFSYRIEKYNCTLNYYYQQQLKNDVDEISYYSYQTIGAFLDYIYDVSSDNFNDMSNLKSIIMDLSKTRMISIKTEDKKICIKKATVLNGYDENDSNVDTDDVRIFYEEIIKELEERK